MDDSTDATTSDDGLHYPRTKISRIPPVANPDSTAVVSAASFVPVIVAIPSAVGSPIRAIEVETPPPQHNSPRAVVTALLAVTGVLAIIFIVGYLNSQRFRRWKESRRLRHTETKWKISRPFRQGDSLASSMRQVPQNQIDISPNQLVYWSSDPFARSIPRQSRTPFHFHFGRSEAVEEIDEERGWIWGTNTSSKPGTSRQAIPGLGVGKYRPKNKRPPSHASKSAKKPYSQPEEIDETKEELLNDDNEVGETGEYAHGEEEPTGYSNFPSTGVSYLLSRLKESITARSRFSSQGSAATIPQKDSSRGRWNEVGQLVANEKNMARDSDFDDTKKKAGLQVRFDSHVSHQSGPALSEIALPELPAFTWDNNSSLKIAMTKRTRDSSLEVEITGCRSENIPGSQMPRQSTVSPTRTPAAVNSDKQLVSRLEQKNEGKIGSTDLPSPTIKARGGGREAFKLDSRPRSAKSTRLIKSKSKHLYPGGYIGRSPTKKLRKKESPQSQTLCSTIDS